MDTIATTSENSLSRDKIDQLARDYAHWTKQNELYGQSHRFCEQLDRVKRYQDLALLFEPGLLETCFPTEFTRIKTRLFFGIAGIEDSDAHHLEAKLQLSRTIIQNGISANDSHLPFVVLSGLLKMSQDSHTGIQDKILFRDEVINIFRDPNLLHSYHAVSAFEALLLSGYTQTLMMTVDIFNEDQALLTDIFQRVYELDKELAYQATRQLLSNAKALNPNIYAPQFERFVRLLTNIEEVTNSLQPESLSNRATLSDPATALAEGDAFLIATVSGAASRNTLQTLDGPEHDQANTLVVFSKLFSQDTSSVLFRRNKIDTSTFPMALVDMAEGIEQFFTDLAPTSPLRKKLEDFYQRLPAFNDRYSPAEIKEDLINLLRPFVSNLEPFHIFGEDLGTYKLACTSLYHVVWNHREPTYGRPGRRRNEIPNVTWFFREDNNLDCRHHFDHHNLGWLIDTYGEGTWSFTDYANAFRNHFSSEEVPLRQAADNFVEDYLSEAQSFEPDFDVDMRSTRDNLKIVEKLRDYAGVIRRRDALYRKASTFIVGICDKYIEGKLNDQSFLHEVDERTYQMFHNGDADTPAKIYSILDGFAQEFQQER